LLGVIDQETIAVIELKHTDRASASRGDTPLRALLEVLSYSAVVEANLNDITPEMTSDQIEHPARGVEMLALGSEWYWNKWQTCLPAGPWQSSLSALSAGLSGALGIAIRFLSVHNLSFEMGSAGRRPRLTSSPTLRGLEGLP
jgi:hypothetical protein